MKGVHFVVMVLALAVGGIAGVSEGQAPRKPDVWPDYAVPEEEAATAGRRVMPFTQEDIRLLGELVRQQRHGAGRAGGSSRT